MTLARRTQRASPSRTSTGCDRRPARAGAAGLRGPAAGRSRRSSRPTGRSRPSGSPRASPGRVPGSDLASVYRNLETLEEVGLVRHVHLGHGPGPLRARGRDAREYLVCESCDARRCAVRRVGARRRARRGPAGVRLRGSLRRTSRSSGSAPTARPRRRPPPRPLKRSPRAHSRRFPRRRCRGRDRRRGSRRRRRLRASGAANDDARRAPHPAARRDRGVRLRRPDAELPGRRRHERPLPRCRRSRPSCSGRGSPAW